MGDCPRWGSVKGTVRIHLPTEERCQSGAFQAEYNMTVWFQTTVSKMTEPGSTPPLRPWDSYNQVLYESVHPPQWPNPTALGRYNLVVLGAGTAGLVAASGAAGLGAKVALVERHLMGGDCLNVGCVPSKALIRSARAASEARRAREFGVRIEGTVRVDFPAVMERMRRLRSELSYHDSAKRFQELGVDVFIGEGRFDSADTLQVGDTVVKFSKALIATGSSPSVPPIPGIQDIPYHTNETVFSLTELPGRFGIIGAGPIGCEFAQIFARFGSEVFLVEADHGIMPREDRDAAEIVLSSMQKDGVKLLCCGKELKLSKAEEGIRLQVDSHGNHYDLVVDQLLVAVGRTPNLESLGLENAGVVYHKKGVQVDDRLQTSNKNIYAAGDVCSPYQFTHAADFMARVVIQNALFKGRAKVSHLKIPWCTYTSPELAHVGMYESEARAQDIPCDVFTQEMKSVDRAVLDGAANGFVRVLARKGKGTVLGGTIVAENAGDMISHLTLAMEGGLPLKTVANAIHPYPTQMEAVRKTGDLFNRTRLTPFVKSLFEKWLRWNR